MLRLINHISLPGKDQTVHLSINATFYVLNLATAKRIEPEDTEATEITNAVISERSYMDLVEMKGKIAVSDLDENFLIRVWLRTWT